jgi:hypothetical protein
MHPVPSQTPSVVIIMQSRAHAHNKRASLEVAAVEVAATKVTATKVVVLAIFCCT